MHYLFGFICLLLWIIAAFILFLARPNAIMNSINFPEKPAIKRGAKYSLQQIKTAIDFTDDETIKKQLIQKRNLRILANSLLVLFALLVIGNAIFRLMQ